MRTSGVSAVLAVPARAALGASCLHAGLLLSLVMLSLHLGLLLALGLFLRPLLLHLGLLLALLLHLLLALGLLLGALLLHLLHLGLLPMLLLFTNLLLLHLLLALGLLLGALLLLLLLLHLGLLLALLLFAGLRDWLLALGQLLGVLLLHLLQLGVPLLHLLLHCLLALDWLLRAWLQGLLRHGGLHLRCLRWMGPGAAGAITRVLRLQKGMTIGRARQARSPVAPLGKVRQPLRLCRQGARCWLALVQGMAIGCHGGGTDGSARGCARSHRARRSKDACSLRLPAW
ncbi:MAG: hypothetical protein L0H10_24155, partial [Comamonas sp.]|nr:hypothetical protein [Comamonas sp.]